MLKLIDDILKGLPENARLRADITKLATEIEQRDALIQKLQAELRDVHAEIQRLRPAFEEHGGLLWKRTGTGFEPRPRCPECSTHPVMMEFPPGKPALWRCPSGRHQFGYATPPTA